MLSYPARLPLVLRHSSASEASAMSYINRLNCVKSKKSGCPSQRGADREEAVLDNSIASALETTGSSFLKARRKPSAATRPAASANRIRSAGAPTRCKCSEKPAARFGQSPCAGSTSGSTCVRTCATWSKRLRLHDQKFTLSTFSLYPKADMPHSFCWAILFAFSRGKYAA